MSAFLAFLGIFLLSLFVALLAALQLADYFAATEEFIVVLMALPVFVLVCLVTFIVTYVVARGARVFNAVSGFLALLAFAPIAIPGVLQIAANRSTNPFSLATENTAIALEFIVPTLIAVLVQWGLVRRRWLRVRGEDDLSLWPWVATVVAGLAILNPVGLDLIGQAITRSSSNWLRGLALSIALAGAAALLAMVLLETYIRGRILRRRLAQPAG